MSNLFPRLTGIVAEKIWQEIHDQDLNDLTSMRSVAHQLAVYAETGGNRVHDEHLLEIRQSIQEIAELHGFPESTSTKDRSGFDTDCAIWFGEHQVFPVGEALRNDFWSFMTLVLLPDVSKWRFRDFNLRRACGGNRNVLQRLWQRGYLFDKGKDAVDRWEIVKELSEDAFVSIVERPGLSANPTLSRNIGLGWVRMANQIGRTSMEKVNREAMKIIRATEPVISLDFLGDSELAGFVDNAYGKARAAEIGPAPISGPSPPQAAEEYPKENASARA